MATCDPRPQTCATCGQEPLGTFCRTCGCTQPTQGAAMRLALTVLGLDLLTLEIDTATTEYEAAPIDGGYLTAQPISFVGTHDVPDQAGPYHDGWE